MNPLSYLAHCGLAALLVLGDFSQAAALSPFTEPVSAYLVQVNGEVYREKNPDLRRAPASLTKMMTALIVLERCREDDIVTVSRSAARETGSRIGIRRGEKFRVRDLLAATLIASANDACRALADHAAGSQGAFVRLMNARARSLNLDNTRFSNVCGHDHRGLYSTARDLSIIAEHAMKHPLFADLVSRPHMTIHTLNNRRGYYFRNKNRLIGRYPGARGVKTGTTPGAGQCLVAIAERGDKKVLLVIMHARNRWRAAPAMLDAAFAAHSSAAVRRDEQ